MKIKLNFWKIGGAWLGITLMLIGIVTFCHSRAQYWEGEIAKSFYSIYSHDASLKLSPNMRWMKATSDAIYYPHHEYRADVIKKNNLGKTDFFFLDDDAKRWNIFIGGVTFLGIPLLVSIAGGFFFFVGHIFWSLFKWIKNRKLNRQEVLRLFFSMAIAVAMPVSAVLLMQGRSNLTMLGSSAALDLQEASVAVYGGLINLSNEFYGLSTKTTYPEQVAKLDLIAIKTQEELAVWRKLAERKQRCDFIDDGTPIVRAAIEIGQEILDLCTLVSAAPSNQLEIDIIWAKVVSRFQDVLDKTHFLYYNSINKVRHFDPSLLARFSDESKARYAAMRNAPKDTEYSIFIFWGSSLFDVVSSHLEMPAEELSKRVFGTNYEKQK